MKGVLSLHPMNKLKKKKKGKVDTNLIRSPSFAERGPSCFEFSRCEARESSLPLTRLPWDPPSRGD